MNILHHSSCAFLSNQRISIKTSRVSFLHCISFDHLTIGSSPNSWANQRDIFFLVFHFFLPWSLSLRLACWIRQITMDPVSQSRGSPDHHWITNDCEEGIFSMTSHWGFVSKNPGEGYSCWIMPWRNLEMMEMALSFSHFFFWVILPTLFPLKPLVN